MADRGVSRDARCHATVEGKVLEDGDLGKVRR